MTAARPAIVVGGYAAAIDADDHARNGWGRCHTGQRVGVVCCLGGVGCNVDHVQVKQHNDRTRGLDPDEIGVTTSCPGGW